MLLSEIRIRNFRNLEHLTFQAGSGVHYFLGSNGQGKTSILEAIGFLSSLQSFRGAAIDEIANQEFPQEIEIDAVISSRLDENRVQSKVCLRWEFDKHLLKWVKSFTIDGKKIPNRYDYYLSRLKNPYFGLLSVAFNPADQDIFRGSPQTRREYLDGLLELWDPAYLRAKKNYTRVLAQRNALLRTGRQNRALELVLNDRLVQYGVYLTSQRINWLLSTLPLIQKNHDCITCHSSNLDLRIFSQWIPANLGVVEPQKRLKIPDFTGLREAPSLENLEQTFWKKLEEYRTAEFYQGVSLVGPHRDDWGLYLNGNLIQSSGSQGEVRSVVLALKLTEIEQIQKRTGRNPVFLLDDLSSELDSQRRKFLLARLSELGLQVFVTSTERLVESSSVFFVSSGGLTLERVP